MKLDLQDAKKHEFIFKKTETFINEVQVLYCAILGGVALGQAAPNIQYFVAGKAAGARLFAVLRRQPLIADQPGDCNVSKAAVRSFSIDTGGNQLRLHALPACLRSRRHCVLALGSGCTRFQMFSPYGSHCRHVTPCAWLACIW